VEGMPMVQQLLRQFGLDVGSVVGPDPRVLLDLSQRTYNVFHVEEALGSPYIPGQDFVVADGIHSVIGFGGLFPTGDLFAVILFTRARIPPETADLFRTVALNVRLGLLPYISRPILVPPRAE